jgi:hypothetical protein
MKQFTHAWLAFMAIKRLEDAVLSPDNHEYADSLIKWFKNNKDGVIRGAWYPDSLIKDNSTSHVLKFKPSDEIAENLRRLPRTYLTYKYGKSSPVRNKGFKLAGEKDNLHDRCEALTHSVVDHLKVQKSERKGSAISPTNNQVALWLFMLSHYVADGHMPLHCDDRKFSEGADIHGEMEGEWDKEIGKYYEIDKSDKRNERFFYDPRGYPLRNQNKEQAYNSSYLKRVEDELSERKFAEEFGTGNSNVGDFAHAICQYSYLFSYYFLPEQYDPTNVTLKNWKFLGGLSFEELSVAVLADAIDSIARVWFRAWRRYARWKKEQK